MKYVLMRIETPSSEICAKDRNTVYRRPRGLIACRQCTRMHLSGSKPKERCDRRAEKEAHKQRGTFVSYLVIWPQTITDSSEDK